MASTTTCCQWREGYRQQRAGRAVVALDLTPTSSKRGTAVVCSVGPDQVALQTAMGSISSVSLSRPQAYH
jgi:hypothetical protein